MAISRTSSSLLRVAGQPNVFKRAQAPSISSSRLVLHLARTRAPLFAPFRSRNRASAFHHTPSLFLQTPGKRAKENAPNWRNAEITPLGPVENASKSH